MAGGGPHEVGHLPADPEQWKLPFEQLACATVEFGNSKDFRGHGREEGR